LIERVGEELKGSEKTAETWTTEETCDWGEKTVLVGLEESETEGGVVSRIVFEGLDPLFH
jgi:hypothetical protein